MPPHDSKSSGYRATETPLQSHLRVANVCNPYGYNRPLPGYWDAGCCNIADNFPAAFSTGAQKKSEATSDIHVLSAGQRFLPDSS